MTHEQKTDQILHDLTEIKVAIAQSLVYQEVHSDKLKAHEERLVVLDAHRNNLAGKQTILSIIAGSIGAGVVAIFKHF